MQGPDGNLYGGVCAGGPNRNGSIFKLTLAGQLTTLYNFCSQMGCADGAYPYGSLLLGIDGNFYGATWWGGTTGYGTLFKLTPGGQLTTLHTFCLQTGCPDGEYPWGYLIQDAQGNIYGTASAGGLGSEGTLFRLAPSGELQAVHTFCSVSNCADGRIPNWGLVQGAGGILYGTTQAGGPHDEGTIFSLSPSGLTTLYDFCSKPGCVDGAVPNSLVLGTDGNLYGTASQGGTMQRGTFFRMSPAGEFVTVYNFCSQPDCADGSEPWWLSGASDGNFYGIAAGSGATSTDAGNVFKMTPSGSLTVLHTFCLGGLPCTDGWLPSNAGLFQHTNGTFYGIVSKGGNLANGGTAFNLSTGLAPFVMTVPGSGKAGAAVQILGTGLAGATSVSFNGKAAAFAVVSSSEITATVPAGAATGPVRVVAPGGTFSSNVSFAVVP